MNKLRYSFIKLSLVRWLWIVLLVGWMMLIFIKSNEPYQAQDIRPLLTAWFPNGIKLILRDVRVMPLM